MNSMGNQLVSDIFKALGHQTRLQIVRILKERPLCVCDILQLLETEQSNTSQHLSILKNQGILSSKRDGAMVIYRIKSPEVFQIIEIAESILKRQLDETSASLGCNRNG